MNQLNGHCSNHSLRDLLPFDYQSFSSGEYLDNLLFRIVPVNPHLRASKNIQSHSRSKPARFSLRGGSRAVLPCARRGSTFRSCGLDEQEGWSGYSLPLFAKSWKRFVKTRRTRTSFTRGPRGFEDRWSSESVRIMPFDCGKRSAIICVVLGPKKPSTYSSEYASGFFEPPASHLSAAPLPRNEGLLGQTPSPIPLR